MSLILSQLVSKDIVCKQDHFSQFHSFTTLFLGPPIVKIKRQNASLIKKKQINIFFHNKAKESILIIPFMVIKEADCIDW